MDNYQKQCSTCKTTKNIDNFCKLSSQKDGFHYTCNSCRKEYRNRPSTKMINKIRNKRMRSHDLNKERKWREENKQYVKDKLKEWYNNNREYIKEYNGLYAARNPGARTYNSSQRRIAEYKRTPKWLTVEQKNQIKHFYAQAAKLKLQVDHIVPLRGKYVSGLHVPWNLQLLTKTENCSKSNKFS